MNRTDSPVTCIYRTVQVRVDSMSPAGYCDARDSIAKRIVTTSEAKNNQKKPSWEIGRLSVF
jgi:predicted metal-binding transcription factor (methanogenesis marker protein 9)